MKVSGDDNSPFTISQLNLPYFTGCCCKDRMEREYPVYSTLNFLEKGLNKNVMGRSLHLLEEARCDSNKEILNHLSPGLEKPIGIARNYLTFERNYLQDVDSNFVFKHVFWPQYMDVLHVMRFARYHQKCEKFRQTSLTSFFIFSVSS